MAWRRPVRLVSNGDPQPDVLEPAGPQRFGVEQETAEFPEIKIVARPDPDLVPASSRDLQSPGDHDWHDATNRSRAEAHLQRLETALTKGRTRTAERARSAFLATVHADRLSRARSVARAQGLRMERAGRGPVLDHPVLHRQRRMSWRIYPLEAYHGIELPEKARKVMRTWESEAGVFDRYYLADEVPDLGPQATDRLVTLKVAQSSTAAATSAARSTRQGVGRVAARTAAAAGRIAASLISTPARGGAATSAALVRPDPCLIGVVSSDGCDGDWFILDRWRH